MPYFGPCMCKNDFDVEMSFEQPLNFPNVAQNGKIGIPPQRSKHRRARLVVQNGASRYSEWRVVGSELKRMEFRAR